MKENEIAIIRVVTLEDAEQVSLHGGLMESYYPMLHTTSYYVPEPYEEILNDRLINLGRPDHVNCTLDLMTPSGRKGVIWQVHELRELGADSIALACTGMSTIRIAKELERACGLPVIDPVMAEGLFAYYACLREKQSETRRNVC